MYELGTVYDDVLTGTLTEARKTLSDSMYKIEHCVGQMSDGDLWWRPAPGMNAVGNLLLHVTGNLRQWIVCGVGGQADTRNRPGEFSQRGPLPRAQVLGPLREAVREADAVMASLREADLVRSVRIQAFDTQPVTALWHAVSHFEGHAQEIACLTRIRLGEAYQFIWVPRNGEQGAAE